MHIMLYIWLAVIVIGLIIELAEAGTLVSMWFSVGAVIPFFMSIWATTNPWYISAQVVVFGVVTTLCLVYLRKLAKKFLYKNSNETTNLDRFTNKTFKVLSVDAEGSTAVIKINGVEYTAVSEKEETRFAVNENVKVVRFEGNKVIVEKL